MAKYPCRLRKWRKSAHLSQRELAFLLNLRSQGAMSDIEAGIKRPSVSVALAAALVVDQTPEDLFPGLSMQTRHDVLANARALCARIESDGDRAATKAYLAALIRRLGGTHPPL